ncbi:hypothetical protein GOICGAJE_03852 [Bacillus sp. MB95]|nr:hypothetical protein [Bacillus sp. MB95]
MKLIKTQKKNHKRRQKTAGVVILDPLFGLNTNITSIPLPLVIPRHLTGKAEVNVGGGLKIPKNGKYLITFSANILSESSGTIAVYAGTEFLGTTNALEAGGLANFSLIKRLEKGAVIQAIINGTNTVNAVRQGSLTVVRVGS